MVQVSSMQIRALVQGSVEGCLVDYLYLLIEEAHQQLPRILMT